MQRLAIVLAFSIAFMQPTAAQDSPKKPPNIVFIVSDDMDSINVSQREKPSLLTRIGMFWRK